MRRLSFVAYAGIVVAAAAYLARHSEYNWDLIPYTAAVVSIDEHDPVAIHTETYRLVRDAVPAARMTELVASPYMRDVADSPVSLMEQLPFYRIRPAYIYALYACSALGMNPVRATLLVSALAYIALCLVIWLWLRELSPGARFACCALIAVSRPLLHLAGLNNPDALSTAWIVFAFYLFVVHEQAAVAMLLLLGSVLIRSDNVFLCGLFAAYLVWRERRAGARRWLLPVGAAVAAVAWVALWHHAVGNYGWRLTMYNSFIAPISFPANGTPPMTDTQLAKMWIGGLASLRYSALPLCLLLFVCAFALRARAAEPSNARDAAFVALASILVHGAIFPNLEDRFFVAQFVILTAVSVSWLLGRSGVVGSATGRDATDRASVAG